MKYAIELSRKQSAEVIEIACRNRPKIVLQPKAWPRAAPLTMRLSTCVDGCLNLHSPGHTAQDLETLPNTYCQIQFELDHSLYFFEGHILSARRQSQSVSISVMCPERILVVQRRRASRQAIASSSSVQISREQGTELLSFEGQLYNLSVDGLAFKADRAQCADVQIGQTWCVCFEVPEQDHCYKLDAVIRRKMPSSSESDIILGLEFEQLDSTELRRLQDFLDSRPRMGMHAIP